jgi:hypothetical protein
MPNAGEKESFDKLIEVLRDALGKAEKILGPNVKPPSGKPHETVEHAFDVYDNIWDLLQRARAGRSRLP